MDRDGPIKRQYSGQTQRFRSSGQLGSSYKRREDRDLNTQSPVVKKEVSPEQVRESTPAVYPAVPEPVTLEEQAVN